VRVPPPDPVVDFGDEMQIMDDGLTQRNGCAAAAAHVAAGSWKSDGDNTSDVDGGATRAPVLVLRDESLCLTRVGYT
jgi:hypothetical protein